MGIPMAVESEAGWQVGKISVSGHLNMASGYKYQ